MAHEAAASSAERLLMVVDHLRADVLAQETMLEDELERLHPIHQRGGRNLAHYLAVRQHDIRDLQVDLARLGLSSLGRMEGSVLFTLNAVERALRSLSGTAQSSSPGAPPPTTLDSAAAELASRADALMGPASSRETRIMVTLPISATEELVTALVSRGANAVRINCAKGTEKDWRRLIGWVRAAEARFERSCRVLCDLAGPNPRTVETGKERERVARVRPGDHFLLVRDKGDVSGSKQRRRELGVVACTLPEVVHSLTPGQRVFYDDGRMAGVVREVDEGGVLVEVTFARKGRVKLRGDKGLNFPDSELGLPSLTEKDRVDLEVVARHADMVGLSFIRRPKDVEFLQQELRRLAAENTAIVLKIETKAAFNELPRLLLTAMQSPNVGVMVARGDMAVEMGFGRLAEAQEEVLWVCEAALIPVIWATQVLESLNKTGVPSRGEVTDAAMAGRAECVMLNQGRHVLEVLTFLRDVLERMRAHQDKKRSLLRRLHISELPPSPPTPGT